MDLVSELRELPSGGQYELYFDNFFTSLKSLDALTEKSIGATGTIRANRTEKCLLKAPEKMKKEVRGSYDFRLDTKHKISVTRWFDNSVVTLASNRYGIHPIGQASHWSTAEKKKITFPQPYVVHMYNRNMGGVDRMDQNIAQYRISLGVKKWWWPFFAYRVDVAMQNAWLIYRVSAAHSHAPLDQLEFR